MAQVVIIGAGLTGISAAYHLEKQSFFDYAIYEKEAIPGGLCRSVRTHGFTFDYTGHLLHTSDAYAHALLEQLSNQLVLTKTTRSAHVYSHDMLTPYPYQQHLYGLPAEVIVDCIEGFITRTKQKNPRSFPAWVHSYFGAGLGKHFFFPYQEKLCAWPADQLTARWTGRFVPSTDLRSLITGAITPAPTGGVGYNAHFSYPTAGGIDQLINSITNALTFEPHTHQCVTQIDPLRKKIMFTSGKTAEYETLISTMPLDQLLRALVDAGDSTIARLKKAADRLHCAQVINVNVGIAVPITPRTHWIYYPEKKYPFYRIGFPHLLSPAMAPTGCSSLSIEISHDGQSKDETRQALINSAVAHAKKLFHFQDHDIVTHTILQLPRAYVVYDQWRDRHVPRILETLAQYGIISTGRYGGWNYSSMQEALLDGKDTARQACLKTAQPLLQQPGLYNPARRAHPQLKQ